MTRHWRKIYAPLVWTATIVALSTSPRSHAVDWKITPTLDVSETYTDNVRLASSGASRSDFITQVSPGISFARSGPRLNATISYMMQNRAYAHADSQIRTSHQLSANGTAELIDNFFFVDGKAGLSQQNISLFGPQSTDNTNITGNRASVATYSISPYVRHRFDSIASADLRYTHDEVRTRVGGLSNSKGDSTLFNLTSGQAFRRLGWGLHYAKRTTGYSSNNSLNYETESASGDLRLEITPRFSLIGTKGREKSSYISTSSRPQGNFWTAGFSWSPTNRTSVTATIGERFFGRTHSFMASHRTRNTVWSINYNQDITSTRSQFLIPATINTASFLDHLWSSSIPDPVVRQEIIDAFIRMTGLPSSLADNINYLTNRVFLQKQLQASVALNSAKSTLVLSGFSTRREAQTAQALDSLLLGSSNLSLNDSTKGLGANAVWSWRLSPRTNFNARVGYTRNRSLATGVTSNYRTLGLGLTKQFRPKVNGSIDLRHNQADSNQSGSNYRESAITAKLHMTF